MVTYLPDGASLGGTGNDPSSNREEESMPLAGVYQMRRFVSWVCGLPARKIAGGLGIMTGFVALVENIIPPTSSIGRRVWLLLFGVVSVASLGLFFRMESASDAEKERQEARDRERDQLFQRQNQVLQNIATDVAAMKGTDEQAKKDKLLAKIEAQVNLFAPHLALAGRAFVLADELRRFIQNHGAARPHPLNRRVQVYRALGYQLTHFPDDMLVEQYRSAFGDRMAKLIPQLRAAGATFHYQDDYYVNPSNFMVGSKLESIAVELNAAALALAAKGDQ